MWDDCGKTGCAGGGSLTFLLFVIWIMAMWAILFSEPESLLEYFKSIPSRILIAVLATLPFLGIGWILTRLGI